MATLIDLRGQKFGRLTVLSYVGYDRKGHSVVWRCVCDCGSTGNFSGNVLRGGESRSCGCLARELAAERCRTHGKCRTDMYAIWSGMVQRCTNPRNSAYANYGGRGIEVCRQWLESFEAFAADMGERPKGYGIERIDNDGNYAPTNCRWASVAEQARNRRSNILVCWDDHVMTLKDAAACFGVPYKLTHSRVQRGWSVSDALTRPTVYRGQKAAA